MDERTQAAHVHVVDADLKGYFDSIPHGRSMDRVKEKIVDGRVLSLGFSLIGVTGFEPVRKSQGKLGFGRQGEAKAEARGAREGRAEPRRSGAEGAAGDQWEDDLRTIIEAWPSLPAEVRRTIVELVKTSG